MQHTRGRSERGQSLVELALVLPLCMWILLGIVDFGRVYYFNTAVTNAAREGARYWASKPTATTDEIRARVRAEASPTVTISNGNITLSTPAFDRRQVQVQYAFQPVTPLIGSLFPSGVLTFTTQAVMPTLTF